MALTLYENTQDVDGTEWSLTTDSSGPDTQTTEGIAQAFIDLGTLANGDTFIVRFYEKTRSGDTQKVVKSWPFSNVQSEPVFATPAFTVKHGWEFTVQRTVGASARTINWSVRLVPTT